VTPLAADTKTSVATKYPLPYKKYLLYVGQQSDYKNVGLRLNKVKEKRFLSLYKNVGKVFRVKRDETAELPTKST
jgi:hypothetical protein